MVVAFKACPGFVCRLYLIVAVGIRRLPRTCTSSIIFCCPCDRAGVALTKVQKIRSSAALLAKAGVEKAAMCCFFYGLEKETVLGDLADLYVNRPRPAVLPLESLQRAFPGHIVGRIMSPFQTF